MNIFNPSNQPFSQLELDNKKRFRVKECLCGKSNKDGKFVPYVGYDDKGYCHSCGKTFLPEIPAQAQWKSGSNKNERAKPKKPFHKKPPKPFSFTPRRFFEDSLTAYTQNHFVNFLISRFGKEATYQLINLYHIGTSNCWKGSTVFWQIDLQGNLRGGKIMLYNPDTGKRVKEPRHYFNWIHSYEKLSDYKLEQCLFGEHLLIDKSKPVAIVESEKSAIISSLYLPEFIWLASGGLDQLNQQKCNVLLGRDVVLFPDLEGTNIWQQLATELSGFASIRFFDLLEKEATDVERKQKLDIADYLLKSSLAPSKPEPLPTNTTYPFQSIDPGHIVNVPNLSSYTAKEIFLDAEPEETENWEEEIKELEGFFASTPFPTQPIKLSQCSFISDVPRFIKSHLAVVKRYNPNRRFLPYLHRLRKLREALTDNLEGMVNFKYQMMS